jgi:uncharacterized protein YvpB
MDDYTTTTIPDCYDDMSDTSGAMDTSMSAAPSLTIDLDGDGWSETIVTDLTGDGVADMYDWLDPTTGEHVIMMDTDLDGVLDMAVADTDGDGEFDTLLDPATGEEISAELPFDPAEDPGVDPSSTIDPITIDPEAVIDEDVHGDPMAEIPYHQAQVSDNDCLPTSVAMVATEALGLDVPQADLVDLANELDLLGPDGMSLEGGVTLLEHYGLGAEVQSGSMDDLRTLLDNGTPVIIGLDADDLYGVGDAPFADDFAMGHAVVITGIDDEAGVVYINDPGFPDGAGVAVPIEDFEDAWIDGDNTMIVVDADPVTPEGGESYDDQASEASEVVEGAAAGESAGAETGTSDRAVELSLIDLVLLPLRLVIG